MLMNAIRFICLAGLLAWVFGSSSPRAQAPAPSLSIEQIDGAQFRITWPSSAGSLSIEQTPVLGGVAGWQPSTLAPTLAGDRFAVVIQASESSQFYRLRSAAQTLTAIAETSPADGEDGVAVTREFIARFSAPLARSTVLTLNQFYAEAVGRRILSRVELSSDGRTATLFHLENLPAVTEVRVTLDLTGVRDEHGMAVGNDEGIAGGIARFSFRTLSTTPVLGTAINGRVFASELVSDAGSDAVNRPLEGVTITVDGAEETLRTTTDAMGNFTLSPAPAGRFFVHVDGRTAVGSHWPDGAYYPFIGKAWETIAGRADNLAGGNGEIYLPLIVPGTLRPVSATEETVITFPESVLQNNPALVGVSITVPANALLSDDGTRGGRVGIAPVPPDRLPEPLPAGLEFPIVITVQTDGASNFDQPVPVCFPNLPDPALGMPLPPGTPSWLYSFNHDTGHWEAVGSMTVTEDGNSICTDPGVGILQPGWHGAGPPPVRPPPPGPQCSGGGSGPLALSASPRSSGHSDCHECERQFAGCLRTCYEGFGMGLPLCGGMAVFGIAPAGPCVGALAAAAASCATFCVMQNLFCNLTSEARVSTLSAAGAGVKPMQLQVDPAARHLVGLLQRIAEIAQPFAWIEGQEPPAEVLRELRDLWAEADSIAGGDIVSFLEGERLRLETAIRDLEATFGETPGASSSPRNPVLYAAVIERPAETLVLRGQTRSFGQYTLFVPRDGIVRLVHFYDPQTDRYGIATPNLHPRARYQLSRFKLLPVDSSFPDFDNDGLPDVIELIYGTDPANPDTDGDGILDGVEVRQGTNPMDGRFAANGVIASARTPAAAVDVAAFNNIAALACGSAGIAIFNVLNPMNPVQIAQLSIPGGAQAVAGSGNFLAVASGSSGLNILDLSTLPEATVRRVSVGNVRVVAVAGPRAYAGTERAVYVVDLATGSVLDEVRTGNQLVHDLAIEGDKLYVLTSQSLRVYPHETPSDGVLGAVNVSGNPAPLEFGRKLFVGGGFAYVGYFTGYTTVDVRNSAAPRILGLPPRTQLAVHDLAANGSGLLAQVSSFSGTQSLMVSLYDISEPSDVTRFITSLRTPGNPRAISLFNGLAYVADSQGLQVVNYLQPDTRRQAPEISLRATFPLDPAIADENIEVVVMASVADDVQVRNVEFYIDGARVFSDGGYPFEFRFTTPAIRPARTEFLLRARAIDTGGNDAWSPEYRVRLAPDSTPPRVRRIHPVNGAILGSVTTVTALMNEPLDPASVTPDAARLQEAGADGVFGTNDDAAAPFARVDYSVEAMTLTIGFEEALPPGHYRLAIGPALADLAGNRMAEAFRSSFRVIPGVDLDQDGVPDHLEPLMGLDPTKADTNGNGLLDGEEDFDRDGIPNAIEIILGLDPTKADSDGSGIPDGQKDRDNDGLSDYEEFLLGTSLVLPDTDGDGWWDEAEVTVGSDPLDPLSRPAMRLVASPIVELTRPAIGGADGFFRNAVIATPEISLILPGLGSAGQERGAVVAQPSVEIILPNIGNTQNLQRNTTFAQPPVRIQRN
jgi:hypothetical protein